MYRSTRSSTQLIPGFWVRPLNFSVLDQLRLSYPLFSQLRLNFFELKFAALDIGGGGGAYVP